MSGELENDEYRRQELLKLFAKDRYLAHKHLFAHRHKDVSPEFHDEILRLFYSKEPDVALMAFRGGAKSTLFEEYVLLSVLFRDFRYFIIVGNSLERACERLTAIKNELINNDALIDLFGDQVSSPWNADQIVLANGAKIQALGAKQSMRGVKHNDERPDGAGVDDLEDEETVATEESRAKTRRWFNSSLRPALNPKTGKIRFIGTALHPKALIVQKCEDPKWASKKFPALYINEDGEECSAWPERFSLDFLRNVREDYMKEGNLVEFEQEYMCRAEDVGSKLFQESMIKVVPQPDIWMPKIIMVDPARTNNKRSARTGYAVWSWVGSKLVVHDAFGGFHKPDEIIDTIFKLDAQHNPVALGVEKDGLEEFLMQPLRKAMKDRHHSIPLLGERAPRDKDKDTFIKGLQPFFTAGEVEFAKALPDLNLELVSFPTGRKDVINALAFSLRLRTGKAVYEDFGNQHIEKGMEPIRGVKTWLVMSSRPALTTGMLVQYVDGMLRIYASWVKDGPPLEEFENIFREAIMIAGGEVKIIAPVEQFDKYFNNGLAVAARRLKLEVRRGATAEKAMGCLTPWLRKSIKGVPAIKVDVSARWVMNGLWVGYARKWKATGVLEDMPEDNQYRVMVEGLEAFVAWFDNNEKNDDTDDNKRYAYTPDGRRYITSLAR